MNILKYEKQIKDNDRKALGYEATLDFNYGYISKREVDYNHLYNNRFSRLQCTCKDYSDNFSNLGPDGEKWYYKLVKKQENNCPYHIALNNGKM